MTEDLAQTVARLAATEDIKRLKAQYFRFLDTEQWDMFRSLFTSDAQFAFPGGRFDDFGPDEFVAAVKTGYGRAAARSVHHGHTPEIEVTGPETARGVWAMFDLVDRFTDDDAAGRVAYAGFGHYHEEYRRVTGEWKIASVELTRLRVDSIPPDHGLAKPPVR